MAVSRHRVLLVEDDAALARFVELALEDIDVDLMTCETIAEAVAALRSGVVRLVITDLMLPGESGEALIEQMAADPTLRGESRLVVFSAGLTADVRRRLETHPGVWRLLSKPAAVADLQACVREALDGQAEAHAVVDPPPRAPAPVQTVPDVVLERFGGDAELYAAFRGACIAQFPVDVLAGDAAMASGDLEALRRVAHNLKSVLSTLGYVHASRTARDLELAAAAAQRDASDRHWRWVRRFLTACVAPRSNDCDPV